MDANRRFYRLIQIFAAAWALSVAVFWLFCRDPQMAMLHVIVVQYLFLPVLTLLLSFFLGRETVHPTGRVCAAGLLRRISAVPSAHSVPAGISPLRRRRAAGPVRYPCDSVPFCSRTADRRGVKKETFDLTLPKVLHHSPPTIGLVICPGKNTPEALARNPRRRRGTAPAAIFANPGPSGPAGI